MNEFYVGYLPTTPAALRRFLQHLVQGLLVGTAILALVLVKAQKPFAASAFEFQQECDFDGVLEEQPYPTLLVPQPGTPPSTSRYLLVAPGKHGAGQIVHAFEGQQVRLKAKLIYREQGTMLEVVPGSVRRLPASATATDKIEDLGPATLTGEIVDTKCFLGVMNPGAGKVHRECAARCLSDQIPPGFLVDARDPGGTALYILTSSDGGLLPRALLLHRVGERITIPGRRVRIGTALQFRVAPSQL